MQPESASILDLNGFDGDGSSPVQPLTSQEYRNISKAIYSKITLEMRQKEMKASLSHVFRDQDGNLQLPDTTA